MIEGAKKVHDFLTVGAAAPLQEAAVVGLNFPQSYYDGLTAFLDHAASEQFVRADQRRMLVVEADPMALLDRFASYSQPALPKWVGRDET